MNSVLIDLFEQLPLLPPRRIQTTSGDLPPRLPSVAPACRGILLRLASRHELLIISREEAVDSWMLPLTCGTKKKSLYPQTFLKTLTFAYLFFYLSAFVSPLAAFMLLTLTTSINRICLPRPTQGVWRMSAFTLSCSGRKAAQIPAYDNQYR